MTNLIIIAILIGILVTAVWRWSRDNLKRKNAEKEAEILQNQRDNNVVSIDDADRVWDDWD